MLWKIPEVCAEFRRLILEGWSAGRTAEFLTKMLGKPVTRNTVIGKAYRDGLKFVSQPPSRKKNPRNGIKQDHPKKLHLKKTAIQLKVVSPARVPQASGKFLAIEIQDLEPWHCRYPRGDKPPFTYCGAPAQEGSSYCPDCHALCYYPASPGRRAILEWRGMR